LTKRWRSRANRLVARLQILVHCNFGACTAQLLLRTPLSCHARSRAAASRRRAVQHRVMMQPALRGGMAEPVRLRHGMLESSRAMPATAVCDHAVRSSCAIARMPKGTISARSRARCAKPDSKRRPKRYAATCSASPPTRRRTASLQREQREKSLRVNPRLRSNTERAR